MYQKTIEKINKVDELIAGGMLKSPAIKKVGINFKRYNEYKKNLNKKTVKTKSAPKLIVVSNDGLTEKIAIIVVNPQNLSSVLSEVLK